MYTNYEPQPMMAKEPEHVSRAREITTAILDFPIKIQMEMLRQIKEDLLRQARSKVEVAAKDFEAAKAELEVISNPV